MSAMTGVLCVGVAVHDFVFGLDEMPTRAEKYRARTVASVGGGCAANAAVAVARLGGEALIAGRLGADGIGDLIVAGLEAERVDCRLMRRFEGHRSSLSAIVVDAAGERMIVNYRDPDLPPSPDILPDPLPPAIRAVVADTRWAAGAAAAMRLARAAGVPGVLDAEPPIAEVMDALPLASHVVFSAQGLADLAGTRDLAAGLVAARRHVPGFLAVTDGAAGTLVLDGERPVRVPTLTVDVVDTLGAGDVWHGAFTLRLGEGADVWDAVRFANVAAALKCTRFGGRAGVPTRAEVDAVLATTPFEETAP
jgi:sulfofructose kinase